mmetsp:Transcript_51533/g.131002  ORF Transcript_51533/g.131002 Transcript_51533/m.131002 type:complete len:345 (-) Transcript_51533:108-1142(-)
MGHDLPLPNGRAQHGHGLREQAQVLAEGRDLEDAHANALWQILRRVLVKVDLWVHLHDAVSQERGLEDRGEDEDLQVGGLRDLARLQRHPDLEGLHGPPCRLQVVCPTILPQDLRGCLQLEHGLGQVLLTVRLQHDELSSHPQSLHEAIVANSFEIRRRQRPVDDLVQAPALNRLDMVEPLLQEDMAHVGDLLPDFHHVPGPEHRPVSSFGDCPIQALLPRHHGLVPLVPDWVEVRPGAIEEVDRVDPKLALTVEATRPKERRRRQRQSEQQQQAQVCRGQLPKGCRPPPSAPSHRAPSSAGQAHKHKLTSAQGRSFSNSAKSNRSSKARQNQAPASQCGWCSS